VSGPLHGRTAIVTGASRGIGLAIAEALLADGASVVLTSRGNGAQQVAAGLGDRAFGIRAHASDEAAAAGCIRVAIDRFGSLDILVNNAGTNPAFGPLVQVEQTSFTKILEVNLLAPMLWSRLAWHAYMHEHGGVIINNASVGGLDVAPNLGAYNTAKAALIHLTRHLAVELAPNVRVNAIAPGVVRTRLAEALWKDDEEAVAAVTPLGRIGEPPDIGSAVAFLAGDGAAWITGATLVIDGGQRLVAPAGSPRSAACPPIAPRQPGS
jgi:NAD(P)-dependent dehydrogenase (short-subunit alcohol dehydrogenase family)